MKHVYQENIIDIKKTKVDLLIYILTWKGHHVILLSELYNHKTDHKAWLQLRETKQYVCLGVCTNDT